MKIMTLNLAGEATLAQWMRTQRTLSEDEVKAQELAHDADNYAVSERVSFDTRTMHVVR